MYTSSPLKWQMYEALDLNSTFYEVYRNMNLVLKDTNF